MNRIMYSFFIKIERLKIVICRETSKRHVTFARNNESNERAAEKLAETGLIRTTTSFHDARPAKSRFADRGRFGTAA